DFGAEQLERRHDVLVAVTPSLYEKDELVGARVLVAADVLADLCRRPHRTTQAGGARIVNLGFEALSNGRGRACRIARLVLHRHELVPQVGLPRAVLAESVILRAPVPVDVAALVGPGHAVSSSPAS